MQKGGRSVTDPGFQYVKDKPVLTVITVVYNSERFIERTIKSVLSQTYPNIEYLIVDGASKDKTLDIVKKYEDRIALWVSEKDKGIYDAMNKGQELANGEYVIFLNSGDIFADHQVIEKVFANADDADVYYGETGLISEEGEDVGMRRLKAPEKFNWKSLRYGMMVCHQSFIVRKNILKPYDLQYRISSDIDWMISALKNSTQQKIVNTHVMISKFMEGGMSQVNRRKALEERYHILKKYYGFIPNIFNHLYITLRLIGHAFKK